MSICSMISFYYKKIFLIDNSTEIRDMLSYMYLNYDSLVRHQTDSLCNPPTTAYIEHDDFHSSCLSQCCQICRLLSGLSRQMHGLPQAS